jgi:DNA processing protein
MSRTIIPIAPCIFISYLNRCQKFNRQSSIVNRQSSIVNRQSSIVNRQSSIVNRHSSITNYQLLMTELLYQLALTQVPQIGAVQAKILVQHFGEVGAIFKAKKHQLESIEGIGSVRASAIRAFHDFSAAEKELQFLEQYKIKPLFLTDGAYPQRLLHCTDAPSLLFYKGAADLNASKVLAIIGTRTNTEYGKKCTDALVADLAAHGVLIVSGLAYGIDAIAHKAALKNGLPTVGVVGHGLDKIYPHQHSTLAREMVLGPGGLLSEFWSGTGPDKHNFPLRNRIVAGMSDATLVIETDIRGGSMITAQLADGYNRDVFALPGRTTDSKSRGCNHLIQQNRAIMFTDAEQLLQALGWQTEKQKAKPAQRVLFIELTPEEQTVVAMLQQKDAVHIDEINLRSGFSSSTTAAAILNLELSNVVQSLPGKMYKLA